MKILYPDSISGYPDIRILYPDIRILYPKLVCFGYHFLENLPQSESITKSVHLIKKMMRRSICIPFFGFWSPFLLRFDSDK